MLVQLIACVSLSLKMTIRSCFDGQSLLLLSWIVFYREADQEMHECNIFKASLVRPIAASSPQLSAEISASDIEKDTQSQGFIKSSKTSVHSSECMQSHCRARIQSNDRAMMQKMGWKQSEKSLWTWQWWAQVQVSWNMFELKAYGTGVRSSNGSELVLW